MLATNADKPFTQGFRVIEKDEEIPDDTPVFIYNPQLHETGRLKAYRMSASSDYKSEGYKIQYKCYTEDGSSGGPVFIVKNGELVLIGVHQYAVTSKEANFKAGGCAIFANNFQ
jgi:hypothetical protein